ncbi:hypothetical protein BC830DRAFT_1233228 [Chytriomyces sp. MP71]|nr:hypothetical protein BC830DRAFT_1233228 [Chytriomyces sp. MP71]
MPPLRRPSSAAGGGTACSSELSTTDGGASAMRIGVGKKNGGANWDLSPVVAEARDDSEAILKTTVVPADSFLRGQEEVVESGEKYAENARVERASVLTTVVALGVTIPILYGASAFIFTQLYFKGILSVYLIPAFKVYFGVQVKDVAAFSVLVSAVLTFGVSTFLSTVARAASDEGLDYGTSRVKTYKGVVLRLKSAHDSLAEAFPLLVTAVILSGQAGVSQSIRSQFTSYAVCSQIIYYVMFVGGYDFVRTIANASFLAPCAFMICSSAIPGFSKTMLKQFGG